MSLTVTNPSYDRVYPMYAWRDNNVRLVLTQGEGATTLDGTAARIKAPRFQLRDDQGVMDLSGSPVISLALTRPDKSEDLLACTIIDATNGIISCPITASATAIAGQAVGEIRLSSTNGTIKFFGVHALIYDGVSNSAAAQSTQFSALVDALQKVATVDPDGSNTVTLDSAIVENGTNPVASGVIYAALQVLDNAKIDKDKAVKYTGSNDLSECVDNGVLYRVHDGTTYQILLCNSGDAYRVQYMFKRSGEVVFRTSAKSNDTWGAWSTWSPIGTTSNIADGAVTTAKIADNAVTAQKISGSAVTTEKINNGAVTESKVGNGAITTDKIHDSAVNTNKIADSAVTSDKIDASVVTRGIIYDFVTALTALDSTITDNGTKPVASGTIKNYLEGSFQDYLVGRFTKRIYAHETHSSGYDADTNPVDTYSDGGVYIDEALDPSTIYIIKNANGAHIGTLLCAHTNGYNRTTQMALYSDGRFQYRYRHNTSGVWDEWENIARDSTVFDAVVRNYQDVTPDITFDIHNTAIATYLTESAVYSPNDYDVTKVPTSLSGTPYDTPNTTTIDLPTGSSKVILYDTVAKTEQVISVSGSTYTITNLIPNRVYAYTVRNSSGTMLSYGTVKATGHIRMIDGGGNTFNIRDLGGWTCDGGKTKYGLIYRGAELNGAVSLNSSQVDFFKNVLGIRDEIDLRNPTGTGVGSGALGLGVDYVNIYTNYSPYALQDLYRQERVDIIKRIAKNIKEKKVTYIHCSAGADRTAIICTFIEAICGVSQNDIDRDYELTAFAYDTNNSRLSTRTRNNTWLNGHRVMINGDGTETYSYPYINNMEGSSFQDKIVRFLLRSGVTIDELNDIRFGLIDGNPSKLTNPYGTVTVTPTLSHVAIDNPATTITKYQPYEATLVAEDLYKITSLSITMGGVDASSYYSNGKLSIPIVTGNIVIAATGTLLDNQIVVFSHTLTSSGWNSNNEQTITLPSSYTVTSDVIADTEIDSTSYNQLCADGCGGIYISSERSGSNLTLAAHALNNKPTANVTIQVTLTKVSDLSE